MFSSAAWLHLRIPFSYFLLPVFLFSISVSPNINGHYLLWTFFIVHFLLYPASNGYNSYFDKDEKSIGGLKNPPPVNRELYYLSLSFDLAAIIAGLLLVNLTFAVMLLIYGLSSKAYSHPAIRLKKHAIGSWIFTGLFQGLFSFLMCYAGVNNYSIFQLFRNDVIIPGFLASIVLMANYPMTQIYQHEEDSKRGDETLSYKLGIRGTFYFSAGIFALALSGFIFYLSASFTANLAKVFAIMVSPIVFYFIYWFTSITKDESKVDYSHSMLLNVISATCLNAFFIYLSNIHGHGDTSL